MYRVLNEFIDINSGKRILFGSLIEIKGEQRAKELLSAGVVEEIKPLFILDQKEETKAKK